MLLLQNIVHQRVSQSQVCTKKLLYLPVVHIQECLGKRWMQKLIEDDRRGSPRSFFHQMISEVLSVIKARECSNCWVKLLSPLLESQGWWHWLCARREKAVYYGAIWSHCGDHQGILPKMTGIYPKVYRRMQASELLDLKDLQSRKQNYDVSKVQCLNRCTLLIESACRFSTTKARSSF